MTSPLCLTSDSTHETTFNIAFPFPYHKLFHLNDFLLAQRDRIYFINHNGQSFRPFSFLRSLRSCKSFNLSPNAHYIVASSNHNISVYDLSSQTVTTLPLYTSPARSIVCCYFPFSPSSPQPMLAISDCGTMIAALSDELGIYHNSQWHSFSTPLSSCTSSTILSFSSASPLHEPLLSMVQCDLIFSDQGVELLIYIRVVQAVEGENDLTGVDRRVVINVDYDLLEHFNVRRLINSEKASIMSSFDPHSKFCVFCTFFGLIVTFPVAIVNDDSLDKVISINQQSITSLPFVYQSFTVTIVDQLPFSIVDCCCFNSLYICLLLSTGSVMFFTRGLLECRSKLRQSSTLPLKISPVFNPRRLAFFGRSVNSDCFIVSDGSAMSRVDMSNISLTDHLSNLIDSHEISVSDKCRELFICACSLTFSENVDSQALSGLVLNFLIDNRSISQIFDLLYHDYYCHYFVNILNTDADTSLTSRRDHEEITTRLKKIYAQYLSSNHQIFTKPKSYKFYFSHLSVSSLDSSMNNLSNVKNLVYLYYDLLAQLNPKVVDLYLKCDENLDVLTTDTSSKSITSSFSLILALVRINQNFLDFGRKSFLVSPPPEISAERPKVEINCAEFYDLCVKISDSQLLRSLILACQSRVVVNFLLMEIPVNSDVIKQFCSIIHRNFSKVDPKFLNSVFSTLLLKNELIVAEMFYRLNLPDKFLNVTLINELITSLLSRLFDLDNVSFFDFFRTNVNKALFGQSIEFVAHNKKTSHEFHQILPDLIGVLIIKYNSRVNLEIFFPKYFELVYFAHLREKISYFVENNNYFFKSDINSKSLVTNFLKITAFSHIFPNFWCNFLNILQELPSNILDELKFSLSVSKVCPFCIYCIPPRFISMTSQIFGDNLLNQNKDHCCRSSTTDHSLVKKLVAKYLVNLRDRAIASFPHANISLSQVNLTIPNFQVALSLFNELFSTDDTCTVDESSSSVNQSQTPVNSGPANNDLLASPLSKTHQNLEFSSHEEFLGSLAHQIFESTRKHHVSKSLSRSSLVKILSDKGVRINMKTTKKSTNSSPSPFEPKVERKQLKYLSEIPKKKRSLKEKFGGIENFRELERDQESIKKSREYAELTHKLKSKSSPKVDNTKRKTPIKRAKKSELSSKEINNLSNFDWTSPARKISFDLTDVSSSHQNSDKIFIEPLSSDLYLSPETIQFESPIISSWELLNTSQKLTESDEQKLFYDLYYG
ncbi:hypothetical protein P9112_000493 [Eukaryota sp. TZLM1-RC]